MAKTESTRATARKKEEQKVEQTICPMCFFLPSPEPSDRDAQTESVFCFDFSAIKDDGNRGKMKLWKGAETITNCRVELNTFFNKP